MSTIFSKIIKGEIPSYKVYEDEHVYAFLDINPVQTCHTLVVPKIEVDHFVDVPEPHYSAVFQAAQKIGKAIHKATKCKRVGTTILGWDVPHFHYHVVPMWEHGDLDFRKAKKASKEELELAQKLILQHLK
jgi:histidine triad (HIT) family protein